MQPYVRGGAMVKYVPPATPRMAGEVASKAVEQGWLKGLGTRLGGLFGSGGPPGGGGPGGLGLASRALGTAAIGAPIVMEALGQIGREDNPGDPQGNLARNVGGTAGAVGLGTVGALAGGAMGGPIGAGLGAWALSSLGGGAGRGLAGNLFDLSRGTPEDRATQQAIRSNEAMARSQLGLAQEALPLETQRLEMASQFAQQRMNAEVFARAMGTYQQALLGAAGVPAGAYADPGFMQALAMAGRGFG
jgi:hypothetical protein